VRAGTRGCVADVYAGGLTVAAKLGEMLKLPTDRIVAYVERALAVDPLRSGFYKDWIARLRG